MKTECTADQIGYKALNKTLHCQERRKYDTKLGELAIVGLPGEVFCEFGLEIKEKSPAKHTIVVELANGAIGYIPTKEAFAQGGYEPTAGACNFAPDVGEKLIDSAMKQLKKLFKN
jgi:hypothetical protein